MNDQASDTKVDQADQQDQGSELGWRAALPDDLKNHELVKGYAKPGDAIQDFVNLKTEAESMLKIPGENATDDEKNTFYAKLGRPETPDKYTIAKPENLPDGVPYDENMAEYFKGVFHKSGLSDTAANEIWAEYHNLVAKASEEQQRTEKEALDGAINQLKDEWKGDKFKVNTELAHRAFVRVFDGDEKATEEAKKFIEETKINGLALGDHPMFLRVFAGIGSMISDDTMNHGRSDGLDGQLSEEAKARKMFPNTEFKN